MNVSVGIFGHPLVLVFLKEGLHGEKGIEAPCQNSELLNN